MKGKCVQTSLKTTNFPIKCVKNSNLTGYEQYFDWFWSLKFMIIHFAYKTSKVFLYKLLYNSRCTPALILLAEEEAQTILDVSWLIVFNVLYYINKISSNI